MTHLEKQNKIIKQIDIQTEVFGKQAKQWMKEVENNLKCNEGHSHSHVHSHQPSNDLDQDKHE